MGLLRMPKRTSYTVVLVGALLATSLVLALRYGGVLEFLELAAYDIGARLAPTKVEQESRVVIVEITEKDIQALGRWPLPDGSLARGLKRILDDNPRAVGLDIYRDIPVPPGTDELHLLFREDPRLIGVMTVGEKGVAPPPVIKGTEQAAFGDVIVDASGVVRRGLLFLDDRGQVYTSLALRLASLYLEKEGVALDPDPANAQQVRLKQAAIPLFESNDGGYCRADAAGYQFLLDFSAAGASSRSYSFTELIGGKVPPATFKDRIVLVGVNAQSVKDHFITPVTSGAVGDQEVAGVRLHGQIASQLLRFALDGAQPMRVPPEWLKVVWCLAWGIAGGVALLLCGAAFGAFLQQWWIPLVPPAFSFAIAAAAVTAYVTGLEKRERATLMQIFSSHVAPEIAEMIWQQRGALLVEGRLSPKKMTATVLFSDLKGFTTISEKMDPQELMGWLNTYMESMTGLIMRHGGVVDNFVGDGIKADFGVPLPRGDEAEISRDAVNAVSCALAMDREMILLNAQWKERGYPAMGVRIGIFTGPVVGGLLGSSKRLKYTTIGDTVNTASRLESFDKEIAKDARCRILIGDTTLGHLGDSFAVQKIGSVSLKGKDDKITVHQVLGKVQEES